MPILRYFSGNFDKKFQLKQKILYIDDPAKQIWQGKQLPQELMVGAYGVCFEKACESFLVLHKLYEFSGSRLFYHLLLDFEAGLLDPFQVLEVGSRECDYLRKLNAIFVWGIHCIPHPHMHVVICSRSPLDGKKLQIKKKQVFCHKIWANQVLQQYGLPLIKMWTPDDWQEEDEYE
jgi:hypothetical protein